MQNIIRIRSKGVLMFDQQLVCIYNLLNADVDDGLGDASDVRVLVHVEQDFWFLDVADCLEVFPEKKSNRTITIFLIGHSSTYSVYV